VPEGNSPLTYTGNFALGTVDKVPGNAALPWRNGAPVNGQVAGSSDALRTSRRSEGHLRRPAASRLTPPAHHRPQHVGQELVEVSRHGLLGVGRGSGGRVAAAGAG
jgi:hypothetical protein